MSVLTDRSCPKCGNEQLHVHYHADGHARCDKSCEALERDCCERAEHLVVTCSCGWRVAEPTLDNREVTP